MARKQNELPMEGEGVSKKVIKEIETAAEEYVKVRDRRMEMTRQEIERRTILIDALHKHKTDVYEYDGYTIQLTTKERVKVRSASDPDDDGDDD